jgi:sodium/bile acid cotransporter 7
VLKKLSALPIDTFLLAMAVTVALAALFPARGGFAEFMSVAAKVVIALLFWLYGARLSPQQAWQGAKRWQLHLLVLGTTFALFPLLGLACRGLVPWLLNADLYNGLLFLCLVPSTVQSSIAFTRLRGATFRPPW